MKRCGRCGQDKPASDFGLRSARSDGLQKWCKACFRDYRQDPDRRERQRQYAQAYRDVRRDDPLYYEAMRARVRGYRQDPSYRARQELKRVARTYGIAVEEAVRLRSLTHCECCRKPLPKETRHRHIDHCHQTGKVRGMVCRKCNLAMSGDAGECVERMRCCIAYLSRHLQTKEAH